MARKLIAEPQITEVILKQCPICKKGAVNRQSTKVLFGLIPIKTITCSHCGAQWREDKKDLTLFHLPRGYESRVKGIPLPVREWERILKFGKSSLEEVADGVMDGKLRKIDDITGDSVFLRKNEKVYLIDNAELHQYRSERVPGTKRTRIAKGVYISGTPASSKQVLKPVSQGKLFLTSKRLFLVGEPKSPTIKINRIVQVEKRKDGFVVHSGKSSPDVFVLTGTNRRIWTPEIWVKAIEEVGSRESLEL